MKKLLSIILVLTLVAALVIVPALAAEDALHSFICPACGGTAYSRTATIEEVYEMDSCEYFDDSIYFNEESGQWFVHKHYVDITDDRATCEDCGYAWFASFSNRTYYCNISGKFF